MSTPDRISVKAQTIVRLREDLDAATTVAYNDVTPEDGDPDELVILGRIRGDVQTSAFALDANNLNDDYTIEALVAVRDGSGDEQAADVRCQAIVDQIKAALFQAPRLGPDFKSIATDPGRLDGPNSSPTDGSAAVSVAFIDLAYRAPLRGS